MALDEAALGRMQALLLRESGGRPLTPQQRHAARIALTREAERLAPRAGRAAAITEADVTLGRITRADGTVKPPKTARKAAKAAREAEEALINRKITEALAARGIGGPSHAIAESLTAAQAPQPQPGTGYGPPASGSSSVPEELAAMGDGMKSPFWHATVPAGAEVPEAAVPLHQMSADEFRAHAALSLDAYGRASGYGGPLWQ